MNMSMGTVKAAQFAIQDRIEQLEGSTETDDLMLLAFYQVALKEIKAGLDEHTDKLRTLGVGA